MASLRFRGGRYYVDYRVKGRRVRKSVGKSRKTAELAIKDIEVKLERQEIGFGEIDSELSKLFEEYCTYSQVHHAPTTQNRYRAILDNFKRYLKKFPFIKKVSQIDAKFFEDYQTYRKSQKAANKTINVEVICLKAMFYQGMRYGLLEVLMSLKAMASKTCPYIFHRNGEKINPNYLRRQLILIAKACGFHDITKIHTLRHTFASHLVMSGVDLPTVKKLLGHADIETTMIYSHLADEHVDRAVDKLSF